jgi:5-methyltetrahydropteroyltriglutamate--homocysteine methyltransferase
LPNQTPAIRRARLLFKRGELSEAEYKERMAAEIGYAIGAQEALGLDVLVR